MYRTLAAMLLLAASIAHAEPGDDLGPWWYWWDEFTFAANSHEMLLLQGYDIRSTERGFVTSTPAIESNYRVNESGDFIHTQWVAPTVRGAFLNGQHFYTPATLASISDDGEIVYFNPAGQLYSSERGLLRTFGPYEVQGLDVNDAGVYTWATGVFPIRTIWRSDSTMPIGQGWNPRINNHGTVCWTGIHLGVKHPICDGEPVDVDMDHPLVPAGRSYEPTHVDFLDLTDDEAIVQKVWTSPIASAWTGGDSVVYHVVRLTLRPH